MWRKSGGQRSLQQSENKTIIIYLKKSESCIPSFFSYKSQRIVIVSHSNSVSTRTVIHYILSLCNLLNYL